MTSLNDGGKSMTSLYCFYSDKLINHYKSESSVHGIIVRGEASESEDEDITFEEDCEFKSLDQKASVIKNPTSLLNEANVALHKSLVSGYDDPIIECSSKISKLSQRIEAAQIVSTQSNYATKKASQNVNDILMKFSSLNFSHLPSKRPLLPTE
ncbi:hypothetical protein Anas_03491 [Armadillidium nasatum]|uniref:Biogenesis of lysosome-related organelles complex 1 subunit 3 n=1 Tax=Armadillidium nasatum TaxID=96803 RepID=A0A5N5T0Y5_9CRUS|nr:hypothetical protein Anas_03491 [Armadillidium nasatum]